MAIDVKHTIYTCAHNKMKPYILRKVHIFISILKNKSEIEKLKKKELCKVEYGPIIRLLKVSPRSLACNVILLLQVDPKK